jgi:hypothetical protein
MSRRLVFANAGVTSLEDWAVHKGAFVAGTIFGMANTLSSLGGFLSSLMVGMLTQDNVSTGSLAQPCPGEGRAAGPAHLTDAGSSIWKSNRHAVAVVVEALCYKPEGRGFDSR